MLGTGNAMCTRCYNTCFWLRSPQGAVMVDAGGVNASLYEMLDELKKTPRVREVSLTAFE